MISDGQDRTAPGSYESPFPKHLMPNCESSNEAADQTELWNKIDEKPKILLMGLRRFQILDCPGHIDFSNPMFQSISLFSTSCAVIFVLDSQENYMQAILHLLDIFKFAFEHNMNCKFEVFIHKVDGLSDQKKIDLQRDISQLIIEKVEEFLEGRSPNTNLTMGFHLTTIYDHSIFEAFSKVAQKLIPYLDAFEHLLNTFINTSMIEKVFMLDVASKIYLAADSGTLDMQTYELFCDMIDLVVDIRTIYTPQLGTTDPTFTEQTGTTITLRNEKVLYLRGLNEYLALACLMPEECLEKMGIIEYNFKVVREGLQRIFELGERYTRYEIDCALSNHLATAANTRPDNNLEANGQSDHDEDDNASLEIDEECSGDSDDVEPSDEGDDIFVYRQ